MSELQNPNELVTGEHDARPYQKVYRSLFASDMYRNPKLSTLAKLLSIYVLTCPESNQIGCYFFSETKAAFQLGETERRVKTAMTQLAEVTGFIEYDRSQHWVLIPNFLKWNIPKLNNQQTAVIRQMQAVPKELPIYIDFLNAVHVHKAKLPKRIDEALQTAIDEHNQRLESLNLA